MTDVELVLRAATFAAEKHENALGTPYINHCLGIASILATEGGIADGAILAAALLHDTVEDTDTSIAELTDKFGSRVASMVSEVTDDKTKSKAERKKAQIGHAPTMTHGAKLIKMADKLYNCRDLVANPPPSWSPERVAGYVVWSMMVVQALGVVNYPLQSAFYDVCFEISKIADYRAVKQSDIFPDA